MAFVVLRKGRSGGCPKLKIEDAQLEIRRAYLRGGPGAIVSGLVWLASALTASTSGVAIGFSVLFFGGMFIFPISSVIVRNVLKRPLMSKDNPGGITVIETVFPMIGGLLAAWLLMPHRPELVFPIAAIAVGAHYFGFRTAYGDWTNWVLGGTMCLFGVAAVFSDLINTKVVPFAISAIEIVFGVWFIWQSVTRDGPQMSIENSNG